METTTTCSRCSGGFEVEYYGVPYCTEHWLQASKERADLESARCNAYYHQTMAVLFNAPPDQIDAVYAKFQSEMDFYARLYGSQ